MSYYHPPFANDEVYHLYNRGVAKQAIFADIADYQRYLDCLSFYLESKPKRKLSTAKKWKSDLQLELTTEPTEPLVEILAYCLMTNHFHLVVRQLRDNGVATFMRRTFPTFKVGMERGFLALVTVATPRA